MVSGIENVGTGFRTPRNSLDYFGLKFGALAPVGCLRPRPRSPRLQIHSWV